MRERLLTTREVAGELDVSPDTVRRWVKTRGLPAVRLTSRATRFRSSELDAWLTERSTRSSTDAADRVSDARADRARRPAGYSSLDRLSFGLSDARPPEAAMTEEEDHAR